MRRSLLAVAAVWLFACAHGASSTAPAEPARSKEAGPLGEAAPSTAPPGAEATLPPTASTSAAPSTPASGSDTPKPSAPLPAPPDAATSAADRNATAPVVAEWRVKSRGRGTLELIARVQRRGLLRETLKVHVDVPAGVSVESGETHYLLHPVREPSVDERVLRFTWTGFPEKPLLLKVDAKGETFTLHATSDYRFGHSKLQGSTPEARATEASATTSPPPEH